MPLRHETDQPTTTRPEHIAAPRRVNNSRGSQRAQPTPRFGGGAGVVAPAWRWRMFRPAVVFVDDAGARGMAVDGDT
jgi:hypothetical protein